MYSSYPLARTHTHPWRRSTRSERKQAWFRWKQNYCSRCIHKTTPPYRFVQVLSVSPRRTVCVVFNLNSKHNLTLTHTTKHDSRERTPVCESVAKRLVFPALFFRRRRWSLLDLLQNEGAFSFVPAFEASSRVLYKLCSPSVRSFVQQFEIPKATQVLPKQTRAGLRDFYVICESIWRS